MQRSVRRAYKLSGSLNQTLVTKVPQQLMGIAIASNITCVLFVFLLTVDLELYILKYSAQNFMYVIVFICLSIKC